MTAMLHKIKIKLATIALLLCCSTAFAQNNLLLQSSEVNNLMVQYNADRGSLTRFYFVPNSPERRQRLQAFTKEYLSKLSALPFENFSTDGKVDYILLKRKLDNELRLLDKEETEYNQVSKYFPFADDIYALEKKRRRGASLNGEQLAKQLNELSKAINRSSKALKTEPAIPRPLAIRAENTIKGLQLALKSVFEFYNGYDPQFTWWVPVPYKAADSNLTLYSTHLFKKADTAFMSKDDGSGIIGNPIGREELIRQLQFEMIPCSPEEIIEIANKEFAWCDKEMLKASNEMGFGNDWKAALEKVKTTYVPEGKQPEMILGLYDQSIDFIKKHNLVTIPPLAEETWRMNMMSAKQQLVSPFFLGGEAILIAYPTDGMDQDAKMMSMRGNNPHFSRATVHHELIAGHHLQGFMNDRYKAYRNFYTPFWTEGWSLYWEFILWDEGFPRNAEDRVGMLFWHMHRCARIIFSLSYHMNKWTPNSALIF